MRLAALIAVLAVALAIGGVSVFYPTPPRTVTMISGPEGGAYAEIGERYKELLAQQGVRLVLLHSAGSIENLAKLGDPRSGVGIGLVQGGVAGPRPAPALRSLGTLFYEPLWSFYRCAAMRDGSLDQLVGKRIVVGPMGSGMRALSVELLSRAGIDARNAVLLPLTPVDAAQALLDGSADAAMILASWDAPVVQQLLTSDKICLVSLRHVDAYIALYPFLSKLVLPAGVIDLARDRPPVDVPLLAVKASLIVRRDLHPAIQYLLLDAASEIHSHPGTFQAAGRFPAAESIDFPLSETARHFYNSGRPWLQRYLPLWLAVLTEQLLILSIPLLGVAYPLCRFVPALYDWGMRRRIFRLYGELKLIELELDRCDANRSAPANLCQMLDALEERASHLRVPLGYAHMLYALRYHAGLVRARLEHAPPAVVAR